MFTLNNLKAAPILENQLLLHNLLKNSRYDLALQISSTDANCAGIGGSATILVVGGSSPYSYSWTPAAAGNTSSITVVGNAPLAATTSTYGLIVSDGCTIPSAQTVFTVITNPLPTVSLTASSREECAPANITFTATPGTPGSYSYDWISDFKDVMGSGQVITYNYEKLRIEICA